MTAFLFPLFLRTQPLEKIIISTTIMKDNQYLMISIRVYYETFALIMTKACIRGKSFLDKRTFCEQAFFSSKRKKNYCIKRPRNHLSRTPLYCIIKHFRRNFISELRPIRLNARNRFKFTEHLDRIVEIIRPNEQVGWKSEWLWLRIQWMILRFGEFKQYYESLIFLFNYGTIKNTKLTILCINENIFNDHI